MELGFELVLPSGKALTAVARLADLGGRNGVLLFYSYNEIRSCTQGLLDAGYGYSIIDEPRSDEESPPENELVAQ